MRILYDLLGVQPKGNVLYEGGFEYGKAAFIELAKNLEVGLELVVFLDTERKCDELVLETIKSKAIPVIDIKNEKELEKHLFEQDYDLLFSATPLPYYKIQIPKSCKFVGILHDLRSLELNYDKTYRYYLTSLSQNNIKHYIFAYSLVCPLVGTLA